jgi:hypothetical protein
MNRWAPKVDALRRLIAPSSGAMDAERETAKRKLESILQAHYGEAEGHERFAAFETEIAADPTAFDEALARAFTMRDLMEAGVSLEGHWEGRTPREVIHAMVTDYARRYRQAKQRKRIARMQASKSLLPFEDDQFRVLLEQVVERFYAADDFVSAYWLMSYEELSVLLSKPRLSGQFPTIPTRLLGCPIYLYRGQLQLITICPFCGESPVHNGDFLCTHCGAPLPGYRQE